MKKVLITGCSSGIGKEVALTLAQEGFEVVATVRHPEKAKDLAGHTHLWVEKADVLSYIEKEDDLGRIVKQYGSFDIVICNAGVMLGGFLEDLKMDEIQRLVDTNLMGVIYTIKAVLPDMIERKSGKIILLSSLAGRRGTPLMSCYDATKFALEGLAESLSLELAPYGITLHLVEPGCVQTDLYRQGAMKQSRRQGVYEQKLEKMSQKFQSGRPRKEVTFQILKICKGKTSRLHYPIPALKHFQIWLKPLIFSKLGHLVWKKWMNH